MIKLAATAAFPDGFEVVIQSAASAASPPTKRSKKKVQTKEKSALDALYVGTPKPEMGALMQPFTCETWRDPAKIQKLQQL